MLTCVLSSPAVSRGNLVSGVYGSIPLICWCLRVVLKSLMTVFFRRVRSDCFIADLLAGSLHLRSPVLLCRFRWGPSLAFLASSSALSLPGMPLWPGIQFIRILALTWIRLAVDRASCTWLII